MVDPPAHTRLRALVNRAFTPRRVSRLDEWMDEIISDLIADLDPVRPNLVDGFNNTLPIFVIAQLLGIPMERRQLVRKLADNITALLDPFRGFDADAMDATFDEFHTFVMELVAERRSDPREDLLSGLVMAEEGGDRLSADELFAIFGLILFAGHETTSGLLGNAQLALARFPEQHHVDPRSPRALAERSRGAHPVRHVGEVRSRVPRSATSLSEAKSSRPVPTSSCCSPWRIAILAGSPTPTCSNSIGSIPLRSRSVTASTTALARAWPAWRSARVSSRLLDVLGDYTVDTEAVTWKQSIVLRGPTYLPITAG